MSVDIVYRPYAGETDLQPIIQLVEGELSEPYIIYTYRYFLHQWSVRLRVILRTRDEHSRRPHLSFLVGLEVSLQDLHLKAFDFDRRSRLLIRPWPDPSASLSANKVDIGMAWPEATSACSALKRNGVNAG